MVKLTDAQRTVMLQLGSPASLVKANQDVLDELVALGLLYKRSGNHYDLTDEGEAEYNVLAGEDDL